MFDDWRHVVWLALHGALALILISFATAAASSHQSNDAPMNHKTKGDDGLMRWLP